MSVQNVDDVGELALVPQASAQTLNGLLLRSTRYWTPVPPERVDAVQLSATEGPVLVRVGAPGAVSVPVLALADPAPPLVQNAQAATPSSTAKTGAANPITA